MKTTTLLLGFTGALALTIPFACGGESFNNPPPGTGGFDPGTTVPTGNGSTTSFNTGAGGGGGAGGMGPPMCDDSLKRCSHVFSYVGSGSETSVEVRGDWAAPGSWDSGGAMTKSGNTWSATIEIPYNKDVQYKFVIDGNNWITDPANPQTVNDGNNNINSLLSATTCDPWTCGTPSGAADPDPWRDEVMYFVFVDRFNDGNPANNGPATPNVQKPADYQGGDYAGVTAKINANYFNDLGVTLLWLTVPMNNTDESGKAVDPNDSHLYSAYHGYWPKDLEQTEGRFGTMAELKALVDAAHAKKIKVILDYAMNHVHTSSAVYQQHQNDGWFWPNQNPNNASQNCVCGQGCSWDALQERERCWFTSYLPDFNFKNQAARDFSVSNAIWWLQQTGADGFRLDAVKHIDKSWLYSVRARAISEIETVTKQHVYMVGETFTGNRDLIKEYVSPSLLDGQFDFPLRNNILRAVLIKSDKMSDLRAFVDGNDNFYGPSAIMSTFIGNHDVPRAINFANGWNDEWYGGANNAWTNQPGLPSGTAAFEKLAVAFGVIYTLKGIPLMYYGDEIGLPGGGDPDNRRFMQWTGYSAGQQLLLDRVKKLGAARAAHPSLRRGARTTLVVNDDVWAFKVTSGSDTTCVVLNRSDGSQNIGSLSGCPTKDAIGGGTFSGSAPARSVMVLTQ